MSWNDNNPKSPYYGLEFVSAVEKLSPDTEFIVLENSSRSYPDPYDDRSGGSNNTTTDYYCSVIAFKNEDALRHWVENHNDFTVFPKKFKILRVSPVEILKEISFKFKE